MSDIGYVFSRLAEERCRSQDIAAPRIKDLWAFRDRIENEDGAVTMDEFREFIDRLFDLLTIPATAENRKAVDGTIERLPR